MRRKFKRIFLIGGGACLMIAAFSIWQYQHLKLEYDWYRFRTAAASDDPKYIQALVDDGERVESKIVRCLQSSSPDEFEAAGKALKRLAPIWGREPARARRVLSRISAGEDGFSEAGRKKVCEALPALLRIDSGPDDLWKNNSTIVRQEIIATVRHELPDRFDLAVARLNDPEPEIRRAALLLVGPGSETGNDPVDTEAIAPFLNDRDEKVRDICVSCLKTRGLVDSDIALARRFTHPDPKERLELLLDLKRDRDRDLTQWLERLSRDRDAAVRLGTARVAAERRVSGLLDRLQQMSQTDPDGTVRRQTQYYWLFLKESQRETTR